MSSPAPRAALHTLGCRLSQAETAVLADGLRRKGYEVVPFGADTDLLVLNTCSVTEEAEKDCRYAIRKTLRRSPNAFVAVTGCYAQTGTGRLQQVPGIDLLVGTHYKMQLPDYLPAPEALAKRPAPEVLYRKSIDREDFSLPGTAYADTTRALLKVQDGCNFMCSFCLIPFARGHERSRILDDLLREAEALVGQGHRELVLTGVNIGRYDHQGLSLLDVIRRLETLPGLARIRISSIEPTTVSDEFIEYMSSPSKLCRYLHIPLQSGNDRILDAMNRRYRAADYRRLVERAAARIPDLGLGSDVLVGFPGEDAAALEDTAALLHDLPMAYFHVFSYSERPGTAAIRLPHKVPAQEIAARSRRLALLSSEKAAAFHRRFLGRTVSVLFEHSVRDGCRTGTTDNFLRVAVPAAQADANTLRSVSLTGYAADRAVGQVADPNTISSGKSLVLLP